MDEMLTPRRALIVGAAGLALATAGCAKPEAKAQGISATEDLMREHGVIRRLLVVYREAAGFVRANFSSVDGKVVWRAADLMRRFGEAYHEQLLEEQHIFPQVMKAPGEAASLVPILIGQHARGRQITQYIQAKTASGSVAGADAAPLADALEGFARMYEPHSAYEDTIVFQAWRGSLSASALDEAGDQFEDIEKETFKSDGFGQALGEVAAIEQALRIHDLAGYTALAPGAAGQPILPAPPVQEGGE